MPLFGAKPKKKTSEESIAQMREVKELLERKQCHLEKQIEKETANAKTHARTNKRLALLALKKKKKLETELNRSDGILSNMDLLLVSYQIIVTNNFKRVGFTPCNNRCKSWW